MLVGHLKSATYQRLMVAVIAKSTLYLGAFLLVRKAELHPSGWWLACIGKAAFTIPPKYP